MTPETGEAWLRRLAEGSSLAAVARDAGVQQRTVKRHAEAARQRREVSLARHAVLVKAIEGHQRDLLKAVARWRRALDQPLTGGPGLPSEPIDVALRAHVPATRSEIMALKSATEAYGQALTALTLRLADAIARRSPPWSPGMQAIAALLEGSAAGAGVEKFPVGVEGQPPYLRWGAFGIATELPVPLAASAREAGTAQYRALVADAMTWSEYQALRECGQDVTKARRRLDSLLEEVQLRHLVPGDCRYCPQP